MQKGILWQTELSVTSKCDKWQIPFYHVTPYANYENKVGEGMVLFYLKLKIHSSYILHLRLVCPWSIFFLFKISCLLRTCSWGIQTKTPGMILRNKGAFVTVVYKQNLWNDTWYVHIILYFILSILYLPFEFSFLCHTLLTLFNYWASYLNSDRTGNWLPVKLV